MQAQHYAILGTALAAIAAQIAGLPNWHAALTPAFVAGTLGVIASMLGAIRMTPPDRGTPTLPLILLAAALALPLASCARPVTITTPQGQAAYTADQIVVRINELQNTAIAANQQNQLGTDATRTIVQFCVGADATLAQTPAGWQTTLITAWGQLRAALPPISNPAVAAALATVDAVMGTIR